MIPDQNVPTLAEKCRNLANTMPEHADELIDIAETLEDLDPMETPIPKLVGTWARCRRRYCEITGDPLV